jgi:hypothetical protein
MVKRLVLKYFNKFGNKKENYVGKIKKENIIIEKEKFVKITIMEKRTIKFVKVFNDLENAINFLVKTYNVKVLVNYGFIPIEPILI